MPTLDRRSLLAATAAAAIPAYAADEEYWSGYRGPRGDGSCASADLPTSWSGSQNVAWKTPLPGRGHASPVIWGNRIFVPAALEDREERVLICLDRRNGRPLWQRTVLKSPLEQIHRLNSYASSTPLVDRDRVYVPFLDRDEMFVAAYDHGGNRLWEARPGVFASKHGFSTSPVPFKNSIILNGDHDGPGYLTALDRKTGKTLWKTNRPNNTRSYCTPIIRTVNGKPLLMMSGSKCVAAYDPETGREQWMLDGPTEQFVAAPVFDGKLLFITTGYPDRHIIAMKPDGAGRIAEEQIVWRTRKGCSYVPAPVLVGNLFFIVSDSGFASCINAETGDLHWYERLGSGGHSASLITSGDRVYFLADRGIATVVRASKNYEVLANNELGEETYASPAVAPGQLFIRGLQHLFAIGRPTT